VERLVEVADSSCVDRFCGVQCSCDREAAVVNVQPLSDGDPRRLGDYDVTGRLGEGGQGVVYHGRGSGGSVAIKLLHAQLIEDEPARARFVREVEVTKRVARFCTAQVLSVGSSQGRPYIVSEYVPGPSLHRQLRDEGPRHGSALDRLAINTATALAAIHQAGVVHRDFKPANVLMGPDGPVVIDFGIARALDASGTMAGAVSQVVGTPAFMAPEQLSEGRIGPHTDMFAWAVTMVFAASGVPAFGHRSIPQVINRILHEEPDLGALDGRLRPVVAACLNKDPSRRPTARGLMDELMGHHAGLSATPAPHAPTEGPGAGAPGAAGLAGTAAHHPAGASTSIPYHADSQGDPAGARAAHPRPESLAAGISGAVAGVPGAADAATTHLPAGASPNGSNPADSRSDSAGARATHAHLGGPGGSADAVTAHLSTDASSGRLGYGGSQRAAAGYPQAGGSSASLTGGVGRPGAAGRAPADADAGMADVGTAGTADAGTAGPGTMRLPLDGSGSFAGVPGSSAAGEAGGRHIPASGFASSGGYPGAPGASGTMAGRPERRKGRTVLVVAAVAAVLVALVAGIGALAASKGDGKDGQAAAPPPSPKRAHHPARRATPSASRSPSRRPAAAMSVKVNPYTPQRLCGGGYRVIDRHALGEARVYLLYNGKAGANCVVTMVPRSAGKVPLSTSLVVKGGARASRSGAYPFYAGPVRLAAKGKCVMWGGSSRTARWTSGWSHCGK
jgi:predicted Ser/Thr protein kinase